MTKEEAIRILDPETTRETLAQIEYYAGFRGNEAQIKAVEEACRIACDIMRRQVNIRKAVEILQTIGWVGSGAQGRIYDAIDILLEIEVEGE